MSEAKGKPRDGGDEKEGDKREALVQQAIAEVLPSDDPFDEKNFSAAALINSYFPTEHSLNSVDAASDRLAAKMGQIDQSILQAVEQQSSAGTQAKVDLEEACSSIAKLSAKLEGIRVKSAHTETTVIEICSDIQTLDVAKRNLTATITVLRRLNMLETALEQLEIMTTQRAYKESASLLEAVSQLAINFDSFRGVPRICELLSSVRAVRSQLQAQVLEEFKMHVGTAMSEDVTAMLTDAAQVVSVLGMPIVNKLVQWFCVRELNEYETLFDPAAEPATLDGVERRYAWLRKWLRGFAAAYGHVFPASWNVTKCMSEEFCLRTRKHLGTLLQKASKELDVRLLLHVIQRTLEFENELTKRFANSSTPDHDPSQQKLHSALGGNFSKTVSGVFKPYMPLYLKLERAHMSDLVKKLVSGETWGAQPVHTEEDDEHPGEEHGQILGSTDELLAYIKRSFGQCREVDTGETMLGLSKAFDETLIKYAESLHKHVAELHARRGKPLSSKEEQSIAVVLNTCEFCSDSSNQLEESVKKSVHASFTSSISYQKAREAFDDALNTAITALVMSILNKMEAALAPMHKLRWGELESVGDQSGYVDAVLVVLKDVVPPLRKTLSAPYYSALCDKCATGFFKTYKTHILKLKRVSDVGVQQLLLDTHAIKTHLMGLPTLGMSRVEVEAAKKPTSFTKLLLAESGRLESLLKVLMSPPEQIEHNYNSLIAGGSKEQLYRVLEMKGLRTAAPQVFDVGAAGQALGQKVHEKLQMEQANLKSNFESMTQGLGIKLT